MTVLHTIASSRLSDPHLLESSFWPAGTQHTLDDILFHGVSLAAAARGGRTPLVRIGEAGTAHREEASRQEFVSVVVARVEFIDHLGVLQKPDIWIDAALSLCQPIVSAARIIGRTTTERRKKVRMLAESEPGTHTDLKLPADIRAGDLLAIPCVGTVPRSQIAPHHTRSDSGVSTTEVPTEDPGFYGVCGK
ncbi:hypothetical protein [uncultured Microbacterium sp.]|uniref:hypothetical protein n=1 Tax=uncultured Microbacterium sp. TaxID=191216 RepID=UPI0035CC92E3